MDRVTQRLWRGVEGPRRCLITRAAPGFSTTGPANENTGFPRYALDGYVHIMAVRQGVGFGG
jgi:hypothetical protein